MYFCMNQLNIMCLFLSTPPSPPFSLYEKHQFVFYFQKILQDFIYNPAPLAVWSMR